LFIKAFLNSAWFVESNKYKLGVYKTPKPKIGKHSKVYRRPTKSKKGGDQIMKIVAGHTKH
jgi:hypothetical protein